MLAAALLVNTDFWTHSVAIGLKKKINERDRSGEDRTCYLRKHKPDNVSLPILHPFFPSFLPPLVISLLCYSESMCPFSFSLGLIKTLI